jgi:hypothetical protein
MIKHKLGNMASYIFAAESAVYRTGYLIEQYYNDLVERKEEPAIARMKAVEEFAIECALLKVHCTEMADYVADEAVQIHGGMGFSSEGPVERAYRDSRINRIFEGTNEINRMVIIDMLLKKGFKGQLDLMTPTLEVRKELTSVPELSSNGDQEILSCEKKIISNMKKTGLMVAGAAVQKLNVQLKEEQEILMHLADMLIEIFVAESVVLRAEKLTLIRNEKESLSQVTLARIYLYRALDVVTHAAREAIYAFSEGDEQRMLLLGLKRFAKADPFNLKEARRKISDLMLEKNEYPF